MEVITEKSEVITDKLAATTDNPEATTDKLAVTTDKVAATTEKIKMVEITDHLVEIETISVVTTISRTTGETTNSQLHDNNLAAINNPVNNPVSSLLPVNSRAVVAVEG